LSRHRTDQFTAGTAGQKEETKDLKDRVLKKPSRRISGGFFVSLSQNSKLKIRILKKERK
jgi:hypothetical protein